MQFSILKPSYLKFTLLNLVLFFSLSSSSQFGSIAKSIINKVDPLKSATSIFEKPDPISTSFKDVNHNGSMAPEQLKPANGVYNNIMTLQRTPNGGFVLKQGYFQYQAQSFCLKAGTQGPSRGSGYMYAATQGKAEDAVMTIVRKAVNHPEIAQSSIQLLLWAIIARAKFEDLQPGVKATAAKFLTPRQLAELNRNAVDLIPDGVMAKAKTSLPEPIQQIMEAENKLRAMLTSAASTFEEMERIAVLSPGTLTGQEETESGRWTLHPDGYYIRFLPKSYMSTRVEIYVPDNSAAIGKEYDPSTVIAAPALTGRQRLLMSGRIHEGGTTTIPPVSSTPAIISFEPERAPVGQIIKINGANFRTGSQVYFGEIPATNIRSINTTEILVEVPENAVTARVKILSLDAAAYSPANFIVTPPVYTNVIVSSFNDARKTNDEDWYYVEPRDAKRSMFELFRTPNGGFVIKTGYYSFEAESFNIGTGYQMTTPGGEGYLYAPIKGPGEDHVMTILRRCVNRPEIPQANIQELLTAVMTGKKFDQLPPNVKATASAFLTPRQLTSLGQYSTPPTTTPVNHIIDEVKPGRWTLHPDGYYVRYVPTSANRVRVDIWCLQGSPAVGKEFDPATHVLVPVNTTKDRLMFSARMLH